MFLTAIIHNLIQNKRHEDTKLSMHVQLFTFDLRFQFRFKLKRFCVGVFLMCLLCTSLSHNHLHVPSWPPPLPVYLNPPFLLSWFTQSFLVSPSVSLLRRVGMLWFEWRLFAFLTDFLSVVWDFQGLLNKPNLSSLLESCLTCWWHSGYIFHQVFNDGPADILAGPSDRNISHRLSQLTDDIWLKLKLQWQHSRAPTANILEIWRKYSPEASQWIWLPLKVTFWFPSRLKVHYREQWFVGWEAMFLRKTEVMQQTK